MNELGEASKTSSTDHATVRLKIVAKCSTDSVMRHSAYAYTEADPYGDYVLWTDYVRALEALKIARSILNREVSPNVCSIVDAAIAEATGWSDTQANNTVGDVSDMRDDDLTPDECAREILLVVAEDAEPEES